MRSLTGVYVQYNGKRMERIAGILSLHGVPKQLASARIRCQHFGSAEWQVLSGVNTFRANSHSAL